MFQSNIFRKITSGSLLAVMAFGCWIAKNEKAVANQTDVSVELMLSIDVSGSVDSDEYNLQMDGYAAAFRDPEVISIIERLPDGLATGVQFWSTLPAPAQPWRVIETAQQSRDFADYLDNLARPSSNTSSFYQWISSRLNITTMGGGTNIAGAINAATESIINNQYNGNVLVIDVSGDGRSNWYQLNGNTSFDGYCGGSSGDENCPGVQNARDAAVNQGITINGLPIEANSDSTVITDYYTSHIKGGTRGFVETARGFDDFKRAAKAKIYQEVSSALTPYAQPDIITTNEDTTATYNLIAGNPDNNNAGEDTDPNGDTLTVKQFSVGTQEYVFNSQNSSIEVTMPSNAILTVSSNGDVAYNPNGQFESFSVGDTLTTPDEFVYTVRNSSGYTSSAKATLDINGAADNPIAANDAITTNEDTGIDIDVLANDTDVDSDADDLSISQIKGIPVSVGSIVNLTSGASITINDDGTLNYNPANSASLNLLNDNDTEDETFSYTVRDEAGNTDTADVTVTVTGITDTFAD